MIGGSLDQLLFARLQVEFSHVRLDRALDEIAIESEASGNAEAR
jgi:hypothetical protein